jgi:hypothetical protein
MTESSKLSVCYLKQNTFCSAKKGVGSAQFQPINVNQYIDRRMLIGRFMTDESIERELNIFESANQHADDSSHSTRLLVVIIMSALSLSLSRYQ